MDPMELIRVIKAKKYGNRSLTYTTTKFISELDVYHIVAPEIIDLLALAVINSDPVVKTARRIAERIFKIIDFDASSETPQSIIKVGTDAMDWAAEAGLIDIEKYTVIDEDKHKAKEQWFVVSDSKEFSDYAKSLPPSKFIISPLNGYHEWRGKAMTVDGQQIPFVKKSFRHGMADHYSYSKMPKVYDAVNRLNKQGFIINRTLFAAALAAREGTQSFVPMTITSEQRKDALRGLNDVGRKARYVQEMQFIEWNKWLEDHDVGSRVASKVAKAKAKERASDYLDTKSEPHLEIISAWSKRMDHDKIMSLAKEWTGSTINYIFNLDTRGRIYAVQNYLSPLGSDLAKALLVFDQEYPVSMYDLCIHISNCFGNDKASFDDRVRWVNEHSEILYHIGKNPWSNWKLITELGLNGEKKTKWQGLAACQEYARLMDLMKAGVPEEELTSALIIGLDSTASGTQILTILGRDHRVAPYVNVAYSGDRVGDFYTYLAGYLKPKLHTSELEGIKNIIQEWDDYARKLAKRNSMTFSYSGTKYGFGQQQWEDRHDYGPLGSQLDRKECREIGNAMYEVCEENIRGGAEIMRWLRDGVKLHRGGAVISWTAPDGFVAFQVADKSKKAQVSCKIGSRALRLVIYIPTDIPDIPEHQNGIAPNWVHHYDSYLLRLIVNGMPDDAPISTVHDQFSTSSYHIADLQETAKNAYKSIACRYTAEVICEEAFGVHRELPLVGEWRIEQIDEAEFIIC